MPIDIDRGRGEAAASVRRGDGLGSGRRRRSVPHRRYLPVSRTISTGRPGLYPGEPENCRRRLREFLVIMAQLGLMLAVFDAYRLETRSFRILVLLTIATLPVHYLATYRWKKPLFVAISILGMVLVNGLSTSGGIVAVSAVLLALAAAPIAWWIRVGLIAALAMSLAVIRSRAGSAPRRSRRGSSRSSRRCSCSG